MSKLYIMLQRINIIKITPILLLFFSLVSACTKKNNNVEFLVNEGIAINELPLDSMFSVLKWVKLETTPESLIGGNICKIRKFNGKYYIMCDRKELLIFGNDGTFDYKINRVGGGPGEYIMLADFDLLPNNDIVVLDAKKMVIYDERGNYKKSIPLLITGFNIKDINGQEALICASGEKYVIYRCDYNGKILDKYLKNKKSTSIGSNVPFVTVNQNKILFQIGFSVNFISYDMNEKQFTEIYFLNNDKCLTSKKEDALLKEYGFDYLHQFPDFNIIFGTASYDKYMLFKLSNNDGYRVYIVDVIKNNELKYKSSYIRKGESENKMKIDYAHIGVAGDCFISDISHEDFALMQGVYDEKVLYDDNPILMEFTVREN